MSTVVRAGALMLLVLTFTTLCGTTGQAEPWPSPAYVRADALYAFHRIDEFEQPELADLGGGFVDHDAGEAFGLGVGLGWQLSNWLRFDLTGEYRFRSDVKAVDHARVDVTGPDGTIEAGTTYEGKLSSLVGLMNLYADLPVSSGFVPYLGAGIGVSRTRFSEFHALSDGTFTDALSGAVTSSSVKSQAGGASSTNFAWALMAGASVALDDTTKLDLGYRYLNLGAGLAASTDIINCECGTVGSPLEAHNLESHEIRVGLRWALDAADISPPGN